MCCTRCRRGITNDHLYDVFSKLFLSYDFWLLTLLIAVVCLMPTLLLVVYRNTRFDALRVDNLKTRREGFLGLVQYTRTGATSLTVASSVEMLYLEPVSCIKLQSGPMPRVTILLFQDDEQARLVHLPGLGETTSLTTTRQGCF